MKRIRIVQGADPFDCKITDADTGEPIEWVTSVRIEMSGAEAPRVWLEFVDVEMDIIATQVEEEKVSPFDDNPPVVAPVGWPESEYDRVERGD